MWLEVDFNKFWTGGINIGRVQYKVLDKDLDFNGVLFSNFQINKAFITHKRFSAYYLLKIVYYSYLRDVE